MKHLSYLHMSISKAYELSTLSSQYNPIQMRRPNQGHRKSLLPGDRKIKCFLFGHLHMWNPSDQLLTEPEPAFQSSCLGSTVDPIMDHGSFSDLDLYGSSDQNWTHDAVSVPLLKLERTLAQPLGVGQVKIYITLFYKLSREKGKLYSRTEYRSRDISPGLNRQ